MPEKKISKTDRRLARLCGKCKVCGHARKKQRGLLYLSVKHVESRICPACRAYERVHGRKAHEPNTAPPEFEDRQEAGTSEPDDQESSSSSNIRG